LKRDVGRFEAVSREAGVRLQTVSKDCGRFEVAAENPRELTERI
jgi:hypothetical protein